MARPQEPDSEEADTIGFGSAADAPHNQVGALFYKVAARFGKPGAPEYSVRPSTDFPELPRPSADMAVLQRDFIEFGYCLVADALSAAEVARATAQLLDQAEAEGAAKVAQLGGESTDGIEWAGRRQLVSNLTSKGDIWRRIATNETNNGALVEKLVVSAVGKGRQISSMHGVVVEQNAGLQVSPHAPAALQCMVSVCLNF